MRHVRILVAQVQDRQESVAVSGDHSQGAAAAGHSEGGGALGSKKVIRLGEDGLAGKPRRRMQPCFTASPGMVSIALGGRHLA